ncbi:MAG: hypothetical protein J0I12_28580 [Candidatus Eremiobacteraeota bacterium]|nr:hypothetical protein [Candidatus Eremiobacteraeota bacterium]
MSAINTNSSPLAHRPKTAGPARQTAPQLPVDGFQPAEQTSRSPWGFAGTAMVLLAGGAALTGCTQAPPVQPIQATTPMPLENPQLMLLPEGVVRVDLDRSTTTTTSTDSDGNTTSSESDDPYSTVGVYMGGGIFRDTNDNLVFVPQLALGQEVGLTQFQQARLGDSEGRWFGSPTLTRQADGSVTTSRLSPDSFRSTPGSVQTISGRRASDEVVRTNGGLEIREWGRARYEIKQNGNGIQVFKYGRQTHTLTRQDNTIHVQKYDRRPDVITQDGGTITVTESYSSRPKTITQTENGFHVEQRGYRPYTVNYSDSEVRSDHNWQKPIILR